jgi:hypothetical protein
MAAADIMRAPEPVTADLAVKARPEWGGYSRASIGNLVGSYLVLRSAFKTPGNVFSYATDMIWDDEAGGLMFRERNRLDAKYSHQGHVRIPNMSMYMYLVSGENGWLRSVTLSVVDSTSEMRGVLSTLYNVAGAMYVPVATPVVYLKRGSFELDTFGELAPDHPCHAHYLSLLRQTVEHTYVKMIVPGEP